MEKQEILYKVVRGALVTTTIIKETVCYYWINDINFDWRSRIEKNDAFTTPEQAIQRELNCALENFGLRRDMFKMGIDRLRKIRSLKHSFESK